MKDNKRRKILIGERSYNFISDDIYLDFFTNSFEPGLTFLLQTVVSKSDIVLDIGANIGCTAVLFGDLAKKVYAFEPSKTTYSYLKENVKNSGLNNVSVYNYGFGCKKGLYDLSFSPNNRSGAFILNKGKANNGHTIEKIRVEILDTVIRKLKIDKVDFVKIDVEGFEGNVIKGGRNVIKEHKPLVVLELNHWCLNAFQRTSIPDFLDDLCSIFPILYAVEGHNYLDIHDESDRYIVMYHHILRMKFQNLIAGFHDEQFELFKQKFEHSFPG